MGGWIRAYRTPLWLTALFMAMLVLFAVSPEPTTKTGTSVPTSEPTPGPHECVVCPIDQECDATSGQCVFVDHTPLPCVKSATYDDEAGFCLPGGVPPAPAATASPSGSSPRAEVGEQAGTPRQPRLPGFGR